MKFGDLTLGEKFIDKPTADKESVVSKTIGTGPYWVFIKTEETEEGNVMSLASGKVKKYAPETEIVHVAF